MQHPDQKYIDALTHNDRVLLDELYEKFSPKIKTMVLQSGGTEADAADVFQEALLAIYKKARSSAFELTCPLGAFLFLVCRRKWLNELSRRNNLRVTIQDTGGSIVGEDSIQEAEACCLEQERSNLVSEKLEELGDNCRELLRLSWSGKSMEDVARALRVSYGYARKRKAECMAQLIARVQQSSKFNPLKK